MSGWFLLLSCFVEISEFYAKSVDPDQTPRSAASDLGLHYLFQCPFYGTPGLNRLSRLQTYDRFIIFFFFFSVYRLWPFM